MSNPLADIIDEATPEQMEQFTNSVLDELEFLRWFYDAAGDVFGSDDVYVSIDEDYIETTGRAVPEGYHG